MDQLNGEWQYMGTEVTDKNGKLQFTIPASKSLPQGMHPVKVVVRWVGPPSKWTSSFNLFQVHMFNWLSVIVYDLSMFRGNF